MGETTMLASGASKKWLKSEYIIWKCETIMQIEEEHPTWDKEHVMRYFNEVERILREKGEIGEVED